MHYSVDRFSFFVYNKATISIHSEKNSILFRNIRKLEQAA